MKVYAKKPLFKKSGAWDIIKSYWPVSMQNRFSMIYEHYLYDCIIIFTVFFQGLFKHIEKA